MVHQLQAACCSLKAYQCSVLAYQMFLYGLHVECVKQANYAQLAQLQQLQLCMLVSAHDSMWLLCRARAWLSVAAAAAAAAAVVDPAAPYSWAA
jgi:hypothetical protein